MDLIEAEAADLSRQLSDDPDLSGLVRVFAEELSERVTRILRAGDEADLASLERLAHQLKGASAGYGFPGLGRTAGEIEGQLRELDDPSEALDTARRSADELAEACRRAMAVAGLVLESEGTDG